VAILGSYEGMGRVQPARSHVSLLKVRNRSIEGRRSSAHLCDARLSVHQRIRQPQRCPQIQRLFLAEVHLDYLGMSFQENLARKGVPVAAIFAISVLFVFLILAALYESWSLPFSVLLSTPIAVFGAFAVLYLRRMSSLTFELNVYAPIGLVMLRTAAKNAILIVEFAKAGYDSGKPLVDAALEGAKVRLRPILMTSFAFILGCVPLWTAAGAGAISRQVMGTAVIGGMLASSAIAIFVIPALFHMVEKVSGSKHAKAAAAPGPLQSAASD